MCPWQSVHIARVLFQVEISTETFAAHVATIRLVLTVRVHVKFKIVDLMKCLGTYRTRELFQASMGELVVFVVSFLVKTFSAVFAVPWLVLIMYSHVGVERWASVECFEAYFADVRLFTCVDDFVTAKRRGLSKAFAAYFAYKRSNASMDWHVSCQIVMGVKDLFENWNAWCRKSDTEEVVKDINFTLSQCEHGNPLVLLFEIDADDSSDDFELFLWSLLFSSHTADISSHSDISLSLSIFSLSSVFIRFPDVGWFWFFPNAFEIWLDSFFSFLTWIESVFSLTDAKLWYWQLNRLMK
jgi:hypothetical protein